MDDFIDTEKIYQKILIEIGRTGLKNVSIALVYSYYKECGFLCIRSNDDRFDGLEYNPNYELIGVYTGSDLPRFVRVDEDVMAHINEKKKGEFAKRQGIQDFREASKSASISSGSR